MKLRVVGAAVGAALLAAGLVMGSAGAQSPGEALEKRQNTMKQLGGAMKALGEVAKGEKPYSPDLVDKAREVVVISGRVLELFPEGSAVGDSRAKPEIWAKWAEFEAAASDFHRAAPRLVLAAEGGDPKDIGAALQAVGKTCGGCHKPFRTPKE